jgi:hypothetical protein
MSGERDLETLLSTLSPRLAREEYVFCTFADACYGDHADLEPLAAVGEAEGLTLIVPRSAADARGLAYEAVFRRITLKVHSSLDAIGLTAAFSAELTRHGISANVIAGYYHDHILVQAELAARALAALQELARKPGQRHGHEAAATNDG